LVGNGIAVNNKASRVVSVLEIIHSKGQSVSRVVFVWESEKAPVNLAGLMGHLCYSDSSFPQLIDPEAAIAVYIGVSCPKVIPIPVELVIVVRWIFGV
jgi:arabinogalactan endo-1,4-beta-galactosidase